MISKYGHYFVAFAFSVWEYWLGKTTKLAASSTVELVEHLAKWAWKRISTKKE